MRLFRITPGNEITPGNKPSLLSVLPADARTNSPVSEKFFRPGAVFLLNSSFSYYFESFILEYL